MFIDIRVSPAFYDVINENPGKEKIRHQILDIHKNGTAPLEHIFNQMDCAGLDRLGIHPIDYTSLIGSPVVSNEEIRKILDIAPGKFIGFSSVDPLEKDAIEKLEEAFDVLKLKGLSLHTGRLKIMPSDPRLDPLYEICEYYNKPIMFHAGLSWEPDTETKYCTPLVFESVAAKHPKLRICLAQFAWPYVRETAMLMVKYSNVYADTGVLYFDSALEFYIQTFTKDIPRTWIDRSLKHQVMFSSGNPRFEQIRMTEAIYKLGFSDNTMDLICGMNALDFVGGLD